MDPIARAATKYRAYRIEKTSTNRLVVVFDPLEDGVPFLHCVVSSATQSRPPISLRYLACQGSERGRAHL